MARFPTMTRSQPAHFLGIDAMRGIAALCVVVFHYQHFYLANAYARPQLPPTSSFAYGGELNFLYVNGHYAVQIFWVISGFVFTHVYLTRPTTARHFWGARIARLYPLHLVTLLYVAGIELLSLHLAGHLEIYGNFNLKQFVLQLFLASNWSTLSRGLSFNGPIWSVSYEMFAYVVFFVCLPLLRRWTLPVAVLLCAMGFAVGGSSMHLHLVNHGAFTTTGYFFVGMMLYLFSRRVSLHLPWMLIAAAVLALSALAAARLAPGTEVSIVLTAAAIVQLGVCAEHLALTRLAVFQYLGDLSYSIYLVHVPIQMTVLLTADLFFGGTRAFANNLLTLPLFLAATLFVATLAHYRFERPAGRYLRRLFKIAKPAS